MTHDGEDMLSADGGVGQTPEKHKARIKPEGPCLIFAYRLKLSSDQYDAMDAIASVNGFITTPVHTAS